MIFQHTWKRVLDRRKTQTRRVVKDGEAFIWINELGVALPHFPLSTLPPMPKEPYKILSVYAHRRIKWALGHLYSVQPGRGMPAIMEHPDSYWLAIPTERKTHLKMWCYDIGGNEFFRGALLNEGWKDVQIRITDIRVEPLQRISREDAIKEGCDQKSNRIPLVPSINASIPSGSIVFSTKDGDWAYYESDPIDQYRILWDSIHKRRGERWQDNPHVSVLEFCRT